MSSEKPNFLSQPVVKNIFMFRNGDPYYDARRIVINQRRVSNFETLLREVTGGIQAPFGAVRNIYTPRGGHKVDSLESLRSGEQYVAAGRERFKRLDYLQIGSRRKRMMQSLPMQARPLPPKRIIVSARFLKPIKEPCTIFVVANGDVLNPALRLLIHQRMVGQFERILELITEKMGLRVLGGVRSLYSCEGDQVTDGNQLESSQLYVAVGRERFKKLPYSDLLFTKPRGTRRVNGMKAHSLPPIYRFSKQNGNCKSMVRCSDSGDGDPKASPPGHNNNNEHLSSIVRQISQAKLTSLRKKRSGQSMTLGISDNDDIESKADDGNTDDKTLQEQPGEEKPADDETSASKEENKENEETNGQKEGGEEEKENEAQNDENEVEATAASEKKDEGKSEGQGFSNSNSDKTLGSKEKVDGSHTSSEGEKNEQGQNIEEEKEDKDGGNGENSSKDQVNDVDTGEKENSDDLGKTPSDNERKESDGSRSSNSNQEEVSKEGATKESGEEERQMNGEVSGEDDDVESEAELDMGETRSASSKDATANGENGDDDDDDDNNDNQD